MIDYQRKDKIQLYNDTGVGCKTTALPDVPIRNRLECDCYAK